MTQMWRGCGAWRRGRGSRLGDTHCVEGLAYRRLHHSLEVRGPQQLRQPMFRSGKVWVRWRMEGPWSRVPVGACGRKLWQAPTQLPGPLVVRARRRARELLLLPLLAVLFMRHAQQQRYASETVVKLVTDLVFTHTPLLHTHSASRTLCYRSDAHAYCRFPPLPVGVSRPSLNTFNLVKYPLMVTISQHFATLY